MRDFITFDNDNDSELRIAATASASLYVSSPNQEYITTLRTELYLDDPSHPIISGAKKLAVALGYLVVFSMTF